VSPEIPSSCATASAREIFDCAGCMKMSSGLDFDLGRVLTDCKGYTGSSRVRRGLVTESRIS
jgi:hypothetical protein